jgi:uncharacterized iron-regulated protein
MRPWTAALCLCFVSCAVRSGKEQIETPANQDEQFWHEAERADVVYLGERHDNPADHRYELELIRGLVQRKIKFAIGWEMFDRTQQGTIDAWAAHAISLQTMLTKTEFQKHWGTYSAVYKQILQITEDANVPNVALNAAPALVQKIAQGEPLTAKEKALVPCGFVATEKGYRNFIAMMGGHPGMNETDQRRFFEAQNTWDQTMASRILEFKSRNPNILLVVLTGRGHVLGGYGIPFYVRQKANLKQIILPGQISKPSTGT